MINDLAGLLRGMFSPNTEGMKSAVICHMGGKLILRTTDLESSGGEGPRINVDESTDTPIPDRVFRQAFVYGYLEQLPPTNGPPQYAISPKGRAAVAQWFPAN